MASKPPFEFLQRGRDLVDMLGRAVKGTDPVFLKMLGDAHERRDRDLEDYLKRVESSGVSGGAFIGYRGRVGHGFMGPGGPVDAPNGALAIPSAITQAGWYVRYSWAGDVSWSGPAGPSAIMGAQMLPIFSINGGGYSLWPLGFTGSAPYMASTWPLSVASNIEPDELSMSGVVIAPLADLSLGPGDTLHVGIRFFNLSDGNLGVNTQFSCIEIVPGILGTQS